VRLLAGALIAWALVSLPVGLAARTWYIKADGTGDAPTIQAGVDSAAVGDTVMVGSGVYADTTHVMVGSNMAAVNVCVLKGITLRGESPPPGVVVDGVHSDICVYVESPDQSATITSICAKRSFVPLGCIIEPNEHGLAPVQGADIGILCRNSDVLIGGNSVESVNTAILLEGCTGAIIDNEIVTNEHGVGCLALSDVLITNNNIVQSVYPVYGGTSSLDVVGNRIVGGTDDTCTGISCYDAQARIAENRIISPKFEAILLQSKTKAIVEDNWMQDPEYTRWTAIPQQFGEILCICAV
jgi:hypothetical protein